jgi:hypothetical protein
MTPRDILMCGKAILDTVLVPAGFHFEFREEDKGSGGAFAWGEFVGNGRRLELHFRHSLGLVAYHAAGERVAHEHLMAAVVGRLHATAYPGFSEEPLSGFENLRADLIAHGRVFLAGTDEEFRNAARVAQTFAARKGFAALSGDRAT